MVHCAVMGCSNNNNKKCNVVPDCRFFSFPKDKKVCDQWILRCYQKHKFNIKTARICSDHFLENDYCLKEKILELPQNKWKLKSDAVPSVNLMKSPREPTSFQQERSMRMEKRLNKEIIQHKMSHVNAVTEIQNENVEDKENVSGKTRTASTQTASDFDVMEQVAMLQRENENLKKLLLIEREEKVKIEKIFTKGQLHKLKSAKQIQWSIEDIALAVSLYAGGPQSYRLLLKRGYPLPSVSTLKRMGKQA